MCHEGDTGIRQVVMAGRGLWWGAQGARAKVEKKANAGLPGGAQTGPV